MDTGFAKTTRSKKKLAHIREYIQIQYVLMEKILSSISKETCISLTVEPQNSSAIEFYKRFGFIIQGPGSCSEDPHDEIPTLIMRRL